MLPNLTARRRRPELMDEPDINSKAHEQALAGLKRINAVSGGTNAIWSEIRDCARSRFSNGDARPFRLLDLACGGGDVAIRLAQRAQHAGLELDISGCDKSPTAVSLATRAARASGVSVRFFPLDVITDPLPPGYDILVNSLFLHHLDEAEAVDFLRKMLRTAEHCVLVDDLVRSLRGWTLASLGVRVLSRSSIVHVDGPRSVEGAFTVEEVRALCQSADWNNPKLHTHWPARFLLVGTRQ
jgi:SAM-dependent methyltransferase